MLTYQLQTRVFKIEGNGQFTFPNKVIIELKLGPPTAFGSDDSPSRTVVKAHAASITINANTGRWLARSDPPLEPLDVVIESPTSKLMLNGDTLCYEFECANIDELQGTITAFKWVFPSLLNLEFDEPPIVLYAKGKVGQTSFRWEHRPKEWRIELRTITPEKLEQHVSDSFQKLPLFNGLKNRRFAAALHYFHIAVRLNICGDSPWEFMAESILNYCKSLEILFATSDNSKDDIRRELAKLDFTKEEIEGDFIPLLILRSWVDVAHPRVAIFKPRDLKILYRYLARSEELVREVLRRVLARLATGIYEIPQEEDLSLAAKDRKDMDRLVAKMKSRVRYAVY